MLKIQNNEIIGQQHFKKQIIGQQYFKKISINNEKHCVIYIT